MESHEDQISQLRQLSKLFTENIEVVIDEWKKGTAPNGVPSKEAYEAQRILTAAMGKVRELVVDPRYQIMEISQRYTDSRALFIAVERRVADLLEDGEGDGRHGCSLEFLADKTGVEKCKLARILRYLCSMHVFQEVAPGRFANNRVSQVLAHDEAFRAITMLPQLDAFAASAYLPLTLLDEKKGPSYDIRDAAWGVAIRTDKPRWDWLEEKLPARELAKPSGASPPLPEAAYADLSGEKGDELQARPELKIFGLAMQGVGKVNVNSHIYDYPWNEVSNGLLVDVGGGVGQFDLQLLEVYPELKVVIQDRAPVLEQAQNDIWPKQNPQAVASGQVKFMPHDFFTENPVKGADVYWLRSIIHDWSDEYCVKILTGVRKAMSSNSRVLICDQVMNTTTGHPELTPAPAPLPANYGEYMRPLHQLDMIMLAAHNGIERTPAEVQVLLEAAGLKLKKIWECRSQLWIIEARLP
ncbi:hypothetical protein BFW01_g11811 [Lasiodiplodia theobromae]|nr:hypothetical protein BFW01_g11811 [Lasiodiplodia theobromae]